MVGGNCETAVDDARRHRPCPEDSQNRFRNCEDQDFRNSRRRKLSP